MHLLRRQRIALIVGAAVTGLLLLRTPFRLVPYQHHYVRGGRAQVETVYLTVYGSLFRPPARAVGLDWGRFAPPLGVVLGATALAVFLLRKPSPGD